MPEARPVPVSDLIRGLGSLAVTLIVMLALLFWPAGTLDWPRAWWFLAVFVVMMAVAIVYIWRVDPELFAVRRKAQAGTKGWDFVYVVLTVTALAAVLPVAGFDFRLDWLQLSDAFVLLGYLVFLAGFVLTAWAQGVNRHFELTVRIQTDREHKVIDTGPYATIRHPGYIGGILLGIGAALALDSGVALLPLVICIVALAMRSVAEENTLARELPGYAEYMRRVRFRWIPGIW